MSETIRVQVRYSGRVQGVGFRATARAIARGHAVSGWVRNEEDGTVLLEAQGASAAVEAFLAELADAVTGNIKHVDRVSISRVDGESGFEVRR